jgi:hypothetical protein
MKFPTSYRIQWFITAFTKASHLSLSWAPPTYFLKTILPIPHQVPGQCPKSRWIIRAYNVTRAKSQFCFAYLTFPPPTPPQKKLYIQNCVFHFVTFCCYREGLWTPHPTPMLDDHPLCAVHDCMFNIIAATLHFWRLSPPSAICGHAMLWWKWPTCHMLRLTLKMYYISWLYRYMQCIIINWTSDTWQGDITSVVQNSSGPQLVTFSKSMTYIHQKNMAHNTLWIAYPAHPLGEGCWRHKADTDLRSVLRIKMSAALPPPFPYAFMMCTDTHWLH